MAAAMSPRFQRRLVDLAVPSDVWQLDLSEAAPRVAESQAIIRGLNRAVGFNLDDAAQVEWMIRQLGGAPLQKDAVESHGSASDAADRYDFTLSFGIPWLESQGGDSAEWVTRYLRPFRAAVKTRNLLGGPLRCAKQHGGHLNPTADLTRTGRLILREPALHTIPRPDHRLVSPADPSKLVVWADWSAIELRIMAQLSQDDVMLNLIDTGGDPMTAVAAACGVPRDTAKRVSYALSYGAAAPRIAAILTGAGKLTGVTEAEQIMDGIKAQWPQWAKWRSQIRSAMRRSGVVTTPWGDRIECPAEHAAVNYLVQGTGASLLHRSVAELKRRGWTVHMTWHDAIYLQVAANRVAAALNDLREAMTVPPGWLPVPLQAEPAVAADLGKGAVAGWS